MTLVFRCKAEGLLDKARNRVFPSQDMREEELVGRPIGYQELVIHAEAKSLRRSPPEH